MTSETKLPPLPMITRPPGKVATAYSLADLHAYATAYARAAVEQAKPEGDAEIARLRKALEKYRGQVNNEGWHSAAAALDAAPTHKENAP